MADDYRPETYGDRIAEICDARMDDVGLADTTEPAIGFLAALWDAGPVLELGVGTGRVARRLSV